jgi:hypothetical protein
MVDKKGLRNDPMNDGGVLSDQDTALIEEFCSLVAEIAARSLTRGRQEPENGDGYEGRR